MVSQRTHMKADFEDLVNRIEAFLSSENIRHKLPYISEDQRSFWCLGFHHDCDEKSVKAVMEYGKQWLYSKHQIIWLCDCEGEHLAECKNRKIGLLIC